MSDGHTDWEARCRELEAALLKQVNETRRHVDVDVDLMARIQKEFEQSNAERDSLREQCAAKDAEIERIREHHVAVDVELAESNKRIAALEEWGREAFAVFARDNFYWTERLRDGAITLGLDKEKA
jgi:hypothetical protein